MVCMHTVAVLCAMHTFFLVCHSCQVSLFHSETQDFRRCLTPNFDNLTPKLVEGSLILMTSITAICNSVQMIALNLSVVYRYRDCRLQLVDGVQKFSCLDITICDHTKVIAQLVYYTHKKKFTPSTNLQSI